ncbi:MAG: DUF3060 domain-containing protein [Mycobacterium sp.]|uniref:DUF3060 domain-containing protein n=1 Tax=Mycobacterium sp. TaxID=1785 RepID=UPI003BAF1665
MKPEDDPEARIRELERPLAETARVSEAGSTQPPGGYPYPPGAAVPPPPPSFGSPSPWTSPRSTSRNQVWWILAAFFIIGTIAIPLGLAVFGINRATHSGLVILSPTPSTPGIASSSAAPSAGVTQAPAPSGSPSPASTAPAGANLTISGIKENRTIACNQNDVDVSGISNKFVLTGHCASLHVSGVQNSVTVDAVDSVEASGFNNQITYHTGSPSIDTSGDGNVVQQG